MKSNYFKNKKVRFSRRPPGGAEKQAMCASRIMIVEDEAITAEDIREKLKALGYNVTAVVASGEAALIKAGETRPDLVLMDIVLKGKAGGIETAGELRRRYDISVVYLTAYSDKATLKAARKTEPYGYLLKPFNEKDLRSVIEMAVYKHGMDQKLKARVKELNCLYDISKLIERSVSMDDIFQSVVKILRSCFQHPEDTCVRIIAEGSQYMTPNFRKTGWKLSSDIRVRGKRTGSVEIFQLEARDAYSRLFLAQEKVLLDTIAQRLGRTIEHKQMEEALRTSEQQLQQQKSELERKNLALGEIIAQIEIEKNRIKENMTANVKNILMPLLQTMRTTETSHRHITLLRSAMKDLASAFGREMIKKSSRLTPREIEICNMIRSGLTSKEIASHISLSYQTIERHRKNIRKKINIANKDVNLASFLQKI